MKLWKLIRPGEVISVKELYRRYYGSQGSYFQDELFFRIYVSKDSRLQIIAETRNHPVWITREKTFFEKIWKKD